MMTKIPRFSILRIEDGRVPEDLKRFRVVPLKGSDIKECLPYWMCQDILDEFMRCHCLLPLFIYCSTFLSFV